MQPLIKFSSLASQLTAKESKELMQTLIESCDKEQIVTYIFNHFYHQYLKNEMQHDNKLEDITNMVSDIIESREKQQNHASDSDIFTISRVTNIKQLSNQWIGEIASYLPVKDYLNFSMTDRTNYLSCYSPCTLQQMKYPKKTIICGNLNKLLTSLKHVSFVQPKINMPNDTKFIALNELEIHHWTDEEKVQAFMNNPSINFSNIEILTVFSSDSQLLIQLLEKCANVRHLALSIITTSMRIDDSVEEFQQEKIAKLLPKLTIIDALNSDDDDVTDLINIFIQTHNDIQSLSVNEWDGSRPLVLKNINRLREIHSFDESMSTMNWDNIIKIATGLQRASLSLFNDSNQKLNNFKHIIVSLLSKCKALNFIHINNIETVKTLNKVSEYIEIGLLQSQQMNLNRRQFVIELVVEFNDVSMNKIGLYISRIVHCLNSLGIDNFMLKYYFYHDGINGQVDIEAKHKLIQTFSRNYSTFDGRIFAENDNAHSVMIITNKNCAISGFKEHWLNKNHQWEY
eukprot:58923_1